MGKIQSKFDPVFQGYIMEDYYGCISPEDSELWFKMFYWAEKYISRDFCDRLQYIRTRGSKLKRSRQYGYIIQPVYGTLGWKSQAEYNRDREMLVPYQKFIVPMLKKLREIYP